MSQESENKNGENYKKLQVSTEIWFGLCCQSLFKTSFRPKN